MLNRHRHWFGRLGSGEVTGEVYNAIDVRLRRRWGTSSSVDFISIPNTIFVGLEVILLLQNSIRQSKLVIEKDETHTTALFVNLFHFLFISCKIGPSRYFKIVIVL